MMAETLGFGPLLQPFIEPGFTKLRWCPTLPGYSIKPSLHQKSWNETAQTNFPATGYFPGN